MIYSVFEIFCGSIKDLVGAYFFVTFKILAINEDSFNFEIEFSPKLMEEIRGIPNRATDTIALLAVLTNENSFTENIEIL